MKNKISLTLALLIYFAGISQPIYQSNSFQIFSNKVVQDKNEATALSSTHIVSNYQSPANQFQSATINFKFAINGRDNEMIAGKDHHFTINGNKAATPVIRFGTQLNEISTTEKYLQPNTELKIRLDLTDVLKQFKEKGFYTSFNGDKIYKEDFKGVFIAGGTAPLMWDFDNLAHHQELQLHDAGDGIFETTIILNKQSDEKHTDAEWILTKDISPYPQYTSGFPLSDAIYNLSLEEMLKAVETDSTFRTGKEWGGVWTRDISYSIILSMAYLQPRVAMNSLLRKVNKKKRIIQDTGTGGAYPCSTDRMIWAVAAWELYKATGDKDWLQQAFTIVKNSIDDDMQNAYDAQTGLVKGESSFLDWREQTYPKWMQPADIYESECLGTNAAHYQANIVLAKMADALNKKEVATKYNSNAARIKEGINKYLWLPEQQYYAQFLYGRNFKIASPRSEALGEALCVLFGIADAAKAKQIIAHTPLTTFGISCIYPQIPNIPPYHNNAIWPFVQTYWLWAAAKAGNEKAVLESIADIYRPAALFLTNKENMVVDNGDYNGTQINSSIMLWSLSGNISIVHKVLFGLHFNDHTLSFSPFVPKTLQGNRTLNNFKYRQAILNIEMNGYGNQIKSFSIDGKASSLFFVPDNLKGNHSIKIILANNETDNSSINKAANHTTLKTPALSLIKDTIKWNEIEGAKAYKIISNGKQIKTTKSDFYVVNESGFNEFTVIALDSTKTESFAAEPISFAGKEKVNIIEIENSTAKANYPYKGFSGDGFVETSTTINASIQIPINISVAGFYSIDIKYANGNGPTNTENKCAIRTAQVDNKKAGIFVLPQRGKDEWSNWGFSNAVQTYFTAGKHILTIKLEPFNENMNGEINQAMLDYLRITKLK